jgi:hypothetical protein
MLRIVLVTLVLLSPTLAPPESHSETGQPAASQPTSQPVASTRPRNPAQARILEGLLRATEPRQAKPILPDSLDRGEEKASAGGPPLLLDGTPVSERLGRLVRSGDRSEFHFSPGSLSGNTPLVMEFNRNALLEAMETEAAAGVEEFIISAEVSRYRGANYLLLRKYRRQLSHGNLSP